MKRKTTVPHNTHLFCSLTFIFYRKWQQRYLYNIESREGSHFVTYLKYNEIKYNENLHFIALNFKYKLMFKELNTLNIDKFYFDKSVMAFILMHNFIEFLETI